MKGYIEDIWGWDQEWQESDFKKHFNPDDITVIRDENRAIGYAQIEDQDNQLYIRMLLLHPDYQRKGIGSHLLKSVIEKARTQSKAVALQVFKTNEQAKKFYEQHGFLAQGEEANSYTMAFKPGKAG